MQATTFRSRKFDLRPNQYSFHQKAFNEFWPAYKAWYQAKKPDAANPILLEKAQNQLADFMPELLPIYDGFREVSNDCPIATNFLTGYQPPAYLVNCSQAVLTKDSPLLIRNYDLSPDLSENLITHSHFLNHEVIGTNECLWGLDDGMNSAGLCASLTFGGSKKVGKGFGIPFIMRYVLESCETVKQAIVVLQRVPSHMAYNITLLDKKGDFATVMVAPDQDAIVTKQACITNHQQQVTWPEQASFSKTIERKEFLDTLLKDKPVNKSKLLDAFMKSPLRSSQYNQQFGTVFTAVYEPEKRAMAYHWPNEESLKLGFDDFIEQDKVVHLMDQQSDSNTASSDPNIAYAHAHQSYQNTSNYYDDSEFNNSNIIPLDLRESLLTGLEYLPCYTEKQLSTVIELKRAIQSDKDFTWVEYGNSLAACA